MRGAVAARIGLAALLLAARGIAVSGQLPAGASPAVPVVHAGVDRTAIWVADRLTYTITIECAPGVDILVDDVAKEKLRVNGLEILSSDATASSDASGRTTHELRFVLTTYRVDLPALSIEPTLVRYYTRALGERPQDLSPAGEVKVPGAAIALRSMLPEQQSAYELRDGRRPVARPALLGRAQQAGVALVLVSLAPVALGAVQALRRRRRAGRPAGRSARSRRQEQQAALARLESLGTEGEAERREAYAEVGGALRAYLEARTGLPAAALTAPEIDAALAGAGGGIQRERVSGLLAACDAGRYASPQDLPSAEACREVVAAAAQLLGGR